MRQNLRRASFQYVSALPLNCELQLIPGTASDRIGSCLMVSRSAEAIELSKGLYWPNLPRGTPPPPFSA